MVTSCNNKNRGFTLIEVLITVAIVGILAAIAVPGYRNYIVKSQIRTAQADLVALSLNLENRYQRTLAYPPLDATNASTTAQLEGAFDGWSPASDVFSYSAEATSDTYTLTATGSGTALARCELTINEQNTRDSDNCPFTNNDWL